MASGRGGLGRTSPAARVELPCGAARANGLEQVRKDPHSLDLPARSGGLFPLRPDHETQRLSVHQTGTTPSTSQATCWTRCPRRCRVRPRRRSMTCGRPHRGRKPSRPTGISAPPGSRSRLRAVGCMRKDEASLFSFYDFPAAQWGTSAPPIRLSPPMRRCDTAGAAPRGCGSCSATPTMVWRLAFEAQKTWRRLMGYDHQGRRWSSGPPRPRFGLHVR